MRKLRHKELSNSPNVSQLVNGGSQIPIKAGCALRHCTIPSERPVSAEYEGVFLKVSASELNRWRGPHLVAILY